MLNKTCARTAKTRAIPSLHRDSFLAKVTGSCPDASTSNAYLIIPPGRQTVFYVVKQASFKFLFQLKREDNQKPKRILLKAK